MKSYAYLKTEQLGDLLLVATATRLVGIYFRDQKNGPELAGDWKLNIKHPILSQASEEIQEYLDGKRTVFSVPFYFEGTSFQREIWRQIALIPFGSTITYSELARRAKAPKAVRAAGAATGRNPLGIVVPCHRVMGKNGKLTGFAGGLNRKKNLLKIEQLAPRPSSAG